MFLGLRHTHRVNSSPQLPTEGCHAKLYLCCFASIDRQAVRSERYRLTRCLCLQEFSFHTLELDYSRSESAERQKNNYTSLFGFVAVEQKSFFFLLSKMADYSLVLLGLLIKPVICRLRNPVSKK